jgi:hypothetical protein
MLMISNARSRTICWVDVGWVDRGELVGVWLAEDVVSGAGCGELNTNVGVLLGIGVSSGACVTLLHPASVVASRTNMSIVLVAMRPSNEDDFNRYRQLV